MSYGNLIYNNINNLCLIFDVSKRFEHVGFVEMCCCICWCVLYNKLLCLILLIGFVVAFCIDEEVLKILF